MLVSDIFVQSFVFERLMPDGRGGEGSKEGGGVNFARVQLVKNQKVKNQLFKVAHPGFE